MSIMNEDISRLVDTVLERSSSQEVRYFLQYVDDDIIRALKKVRLPRLFVPVQQIGELHGNPIHSDVVGVLLFNLSERASQDILRSTNIGDPYEFVGVTVEITKKPSQPPEYYLILETSEYVNTKKFILLK